MGRSNNSGFDTGVGSSSQLSFSNLNTGNKNRLTSNNININKQNKHTPGTKEYQHGKSIITTSPAVLEKLVIKLKGKGQPAGQNKERINFGQIIGEYIDEKTGTKRPTTNGIVHYSKTGFHVVPARPSKEDK